MSRVMQTLSRWIDSRLSKALEALLVVGALVPVYLWLSRLAAGANQWDDLLYLHTALNPEPLSYILNRYAHIYWLRILYLLDGDIFTAARHYWAFIVVGTVALSYTAARLLGRSRLMGAAVSVAILGQFWLFEINGSPLADFSVMWMICAGVVVYLLLFRVQGWSRQGLLVLFGLILYLAFRMKETGAALAFLVVGMGWLEGEKFELRTILRSAVWILAGALAGVVLMSALDGVFLGDPWFAFRPSSYQKLANFNYGDWENWNFERSIESRMLRFLVADISAFSMFGLYFVGLRKPASRSWAEQVLWMLPLAVILFLFASRFQPQIRYLYIVIPLMVVLALAQYRAEAPARPRDMILGWGGAALMLAVYGLGQPYLRAFVARGNWEMVPFQGAVIVPLLTGVLAGGYALIKTWNRAMIAVPAAIFLMMFLPFVQYNQHILETQKFNLPVASRYYPYEVFRSEIEYSPEMKIFVDNRLSDYAYKRDTKRFSYGMLGRSEVSQSWVFNLYFSQKARPDQFVMGTEADYLANPQAYDYAFIPYKTWFDVPDSDRTPLESRIQVQTDPDELFVFITRK